MENRLEPKLRFKEFSDELKHINLEKVVKINPKAKELPNEFVYIDLESVESGVLKKEKKILKEEAPSRAQRVLNKNDILYQTVRPYQKNNLFFDKDSNNYVASTGYAQLRTKESASFIYQLLHTENFVNKVMVRCTGTSYPAINSTDLKTIKINIPPLPEQEKIASFLSSVDSKIEKLEKKRKLLSQYKKGIMQKVFSQEIRFKDKNGEEYPQWEEKKLGEIAELGSSKRIYLSDYVDRGIPFYRGKEITDLRKGNKIEDILYISEEAYLGFKEKFGVPKKNDILITAVGTLGNIYRVPNNSEFYFKDGNLIWMREVKSNSKFTEYLMEYDKRKILNSSIGSTQKALTIVELKKLKFKFPCLEEQEKISKLLSSIDKKIELVEKEVERNKGFKKGLLQQMFV